MARVWQTVGRMRFGFGTAPPLEYHTVRGFRVAVQNTRPDITTAFALERLDAALALIEEYQPWRIRHLRRDVTQLWIASYPSRGVYFPAQRTVLTELSFLGRAAEFSPAQVASSILHESVHARVHEMGLRLGFDPSRRDMAREERLCRRAEIAFGEALPPILGTPVVERAAAALTLPDEGVAPVVDWAEALAAKRRADADAVRAWRDSTS
jgi:hypothetical protein